MSHEQHAADIVKWYYDQSYRVVYWNDREEDKGPNESGWPSKPYPREAFDPKTHRVGLLLGTEVTPGRYLHDVDIDWGPGQKVASRFLPHTEFLFGRPSKNLSHCFYLASAPIKTVQYKDIDNSTLIELRGTKTDGTVGHQTMVPPSVWQKAAVREPLQFRKIGGLPAEVDADLLAKAVRNAAIAMLLAKHLGIHGFGHAPRLAWAGFMLRLGFSVDDLVIMGEALSVYCQNTEVADVRRALETTAARLADPTKKTQGKNVLASLLGERGKEVILRIQEWMGHDGFIRSAKGDILRDHQDNIRLSFEKLGCDLSFNLFSATPLMTYEDYTGPVNDRIVNRLRFNTETILHFFPQKEPHRDVVEDTAYQNAFHPVLDYLTTLTWDGTPRLATWIITCAGAADTAYGRKVSELVLMAAVKRVLSPGCKFDEMLVLESGTQGLAKSTALRMLCPREEWFSDDLPLNLDAKQIIERTAGKWVIEASDLSGMNPKNVEHLKAMLSRQVDGPVRLAYGHFPVEVRRQFIIIGTTNSYEYLTDITGNRRFWPVRIEKFDAGWVAANRDQLWAEAFARVQAGESIRLPEALYEYAGLQQERRRATDPWEGLLGSVYTESFLRLSPEDIWAVLGITRDRWDANGAARIAKVMQLLGFRRMTVLDSEKKPVRGWGRGHGQRDKPLIPVEDEGTGDDGENS